MKFDCRDLCTRNLAKSYRLGGLYRPIGGNRLATATGPVRGTGSVGLGGNTSVLAYISLRNVSTGPTSNEENKQVSKPVSRRVIMPWPFSHVAAMPPAHAAILSRRHPLQIPPPQFRRSFQCVGSLVSYKSLSTGPVVVRLGRQPRQ